jgi:hypothetical protein
MDYPVDSITEGPGLGGAVVLNYGDPAYRLRSDSPSRLDGAERIFIHILAYLLFAEDVCIPVRHILEGDDMWKAVRWATPLLDLGLIVPTQRIESSSFEEYVAQRSLAGAAMRRAEFLDAHVVRTRRLRYRDLSEAYRKVMVRDLDEAGCFRRTVRGGMRGRYAEALSAACREFSLQPEGTPDAFTNVVARHSPELRASARRWAMARYYVTPVLEAFDTAHTREVPRSAGDLLRRGGAFAGAFSLLGEDAVPVSVTSTRLEASIPANSITANNKYYCDALLEVRQRVPEARRVFADVRGAQSLPEAGEGVSYAFRREFYRQLRSRPSSGRIFTLVSSLLGGLAGSSVSVISGVDPVTGTGVSLAVGIGTGMVTNEIQKRVEARQDRKARPWALAIDQLEGRLAGS